MQSYENATKQFQRSVALVQSMMSDISPKQRLLKPQLYGNCYIFKNEFSQI